jgi:thiamine biosynthesis lipoprotein
MTNKISRRNFLKITAAGTGALALGGVGLFQLLREPELSAYTETQVILGTYVTIKAVDTDRYKARDMVNKSFSEIQRLSCIFSRFDSSSELYTLNQTGQLIGASPEILTIVKNSIVYSEITGGLFDVTALPLLELNLDSFNKYNIPPDNEDIIKTQSLVDYKNIKIKGDSITLFKSGVRITLDSIAVGYIVDKVAGILSEGNINNVLINGGGEIYPVGTKEDGNLWKIGIAHPRDNNQYLAVINSDDWAVSTSGDYEANFTDDYVYHAIVDPRTGLSPRELASATVIAKDTITADALSTACIIMGKDDALSMIGRVSGAEAMLVDKNMNTYRTSGFPVAIA